MNKAYTHLNNDGNARRGILHTHHGDAQTPLFMPIATAGSIKAGIQMHEIRELGFEVILSNTYHLHLRPGEALIKEKGGLAEFTKWNGPILTDSGGFQAFSLAQINKITEEGIKFKSHIDGKEINLTPEGVVDIQHAFGIDIAMVLDECTPFPCTDEQAKQSMERSMRWAKRCKDQWLSNGAHETQHLFGIVQGSFSKELRKASCEALTEIDFPGYAVGGVVVQFEKTCEALEYSLPYLPEDKPRYLMGIGTPIDIINAVEMGIDMFDCVLPTRNGRHGKVFTTEGEYNITAAKWIHSDDPIDKNCSCQVCQTYSRSYIRHLFSVNEILAMRLATYHNLHFYSSLMQSIRDSIEKQEFQSFKKSFLEKYTGQ